VVSASLTDRPWRALRWLVLAPHADDETLGAGALIAQTAAAGRFAALVYLTDGSGSHPAPDGRAGRLVATRRREAATALFRLTGSRAPAPVHLGWKDAAPAAPDSAVFARTVAKMAALCRRLRVDAIAVTALGEPHCDHAAAARLAYAVRGAARRRLTVAEYCVWSTPPPARGHRTLRTRPMPAGRRCHALRAHRSQLTASHGAGFRLPRDRQRMRPRDLLHIERSP
jgi:LmbE family N-acetylglucosaminyl deacetylase